MAKPVTITLSHELGKDEVRRRLRDGIDELGKSIVGKVGVRVDEEWVTDDRLVFTAKALGQRVTGTIDIFPEHVRIEAMLPALLAGIAERIAGQVEKEGKLLLEKK